MRTLQVSAALIAARPAAPLASPAVAALARAPPAPLPRPGAALAPPGGAECHRRSGGANPRHSTLWTPPASPPRRLGCTTGLPVEACPDAALRPQSATSRSVGPPGAPCCHLAAASTLPSPPAPRRCPAPMLRAASPVPPRGSPQPPRDAPSSQPMLQRWRRRLLLPSTPLRAEPPEEGILRLRGRLRVPHRCYGLWLPRTVQAGRPVPRARAERPWLARETGFSTPWF